MYVCMYVCMYIYIYIYIYIYMYVLDVDSPDEADQQPFARSAAPRGAADPSPVGEIGRGPNAQAHAHALRPRAGLYSQKSST